MALKPERSSQERCRSLVGRLGISLEHLFGPSTFLHSFAGPEAILEVTIPAPLGAPGLSPHGCGTADGRGWPGIGKKCLRESLRRISVQL
jgi:hypothetical protein